MTQTYTELSNVTQGRESRGHHSPYEVVAQTVRSALRSARTFGQQVYVWLERAHQRRELMSLSEEGLHDIGVGYSEAYREYNKPFWRS